MVLIQIVHKVGYKIMAKVTKKVSTVSNATSTKGFDCGAKSDSLNETSNDSLRSVIISAVKAQRSADKLEGKVSNTLLALAKAYQKKDMVGKHDEDNSEGFVLACADQENFIRSKEAKSMEVDKLPRCWTQAKSNIKAAINFGIDLKKYQSESALRKDVAKKRKALAGIDPLKAAMADLKKDLEAIPQDTAIDLMQQLVILAKQAIQELVPNEPVNLNAEVVVSDADVVEALEDHIKAA